MFQFVCFFAMCVFVFFIAFSFFIYIFLHVCFNLCLFDIVVLLR